MIMQLSTAQSFTTYVVKETNLTEKKNIIFLKLNYSISRGTQPLLSIERIHDGCVTGIHPSSLGVKASDKQPSALTTRQCEIVERG